MSLDKLQQIIEKELANRKVYEGALEVVTKIQGLKQNEVETLKAIEAAKKELQSVNTEKANSSKVVANAKQKAEDLIVEAQKAAADQLHQAVLEATAIKADALKELESLNANIKKRKEEDKALDQTISSKKAEYDSIVQAVETAKSKLKNLLG